MYDINVLKAIRHYLAYNQLDFARYIGVPYSTYCKWEQGVNTPQAALCNQLCLWLIFTHRLVIDKENVVYEIVKIKR